MEQRKKESRELKFIYNSNQSKDKEALGYIKSLDQHYINTVDIHKEKMTERQLAALAEKLGVEVRGLLDTSNDMYQDDLKNTDYNSNDILVMIKNNSDLLKTPIVVQGNQARFVQSPYDMNKMDIEFAEISKSMANKDEK